MIKNKTKEIETSKNTYVSIENTVLNHSNFTLN